MRMRASILSLAVVLACGRGERSSFEVDDAPSCDADLAWSGDAAAFARAIGICHEIRGPADARWGLVSATFRDGHGSATPPNDAQHGVLSRFGAVVGPREGASFGVLST